MSNRVMVRPTPVTAGNCEWPVHFAFRAWYALCEIYGDLDGVMGALRQFRADTLLHLFWAGLLHDNPALTQADARALLEEATFAELDALPLQLLAAIQATQPRGRSEGGSGEPWDWDVAWATWTTEWGQDPGAFWDLTFAEFHSMSNGRAKLYKSAKDGQGGQSKSEGWTLQELLMMGRRR